ncbi:MAG: hypothetical protein IJ872_05200 [Eubacterium sp.]|nr:hypothetical protein [Eubacterium sp.]
MKKNIWRIIIAIIILLIAVRCGFFFMPYSKANVSWWSTRSYMGDRITVNMHITVDGMQAEFIDDTDDVNKSFSLKRKDGYTKFTDRANEYDTYKYALKIKTHDGVIPLNITANHWNWWEITESDLYIDIDTKSGTYTTYEEYGYTAENPTYHWKIVKEAKETHKGLNTINVYIGPKG